jgi:2-keto-4-pentenoate hydratase/2-oxohepta-3-ene-1,7-dioic acid hydratase in catechol pathway
MMKLATFSYKDRSGVGIVEGDRVVQTAWMGTMRSVIESGITPGSTSEHFPLEAVKLHAPLQPGKIIAVGRNYREHAAELGHDVPQKPLLFAKLPSSVIGPGDAITWREADTTQVDYEGELGVIIGRRARNIPEDDALRYVFGYTIANDVSARDLQDAEPQWLRAKGLDTFCPMGPYIVTGREITDPQTLTVKTEVSGQVMQDGKTADMMYSVAALVSYCSHAFTLNPGDMILTGTPSGVGKAQNPPRFLKDGDTVSITIDGIGTLTNPCKVQA